VLPIGIGLYFKILNSSQSLLLCNL